MQDDYSYQAALSGSEQSDAKEDDPSDWEDQETISGAATERKFLTVMSQYEMEILTTLFPKCAETLAEVLRNRSEQFDDEL